MEMVTDEKTSKRKQFLLIFVVVGIYFANVFCRSTVGANITNFADEYGISENQTSIVSLISTFFFFAYGVGQITNSFFITKYNKRFSLSIPVFVYGILTLLMFFKWNFGVYKFIWAGSGICCSFLWMSIMKILSENLDDKYLNRASLLLSTGGGIGGASCYFLSSLFTHLNHYRLVFLVGGIMLLFFITFFFIISWNYKCSPKEYDNPDAVEKKYEKITRPKFAFIILTALIIFAPISNIGCESLKTWTPSILKKGFDLPSTIAIFFGGVLPLVVPIYSPITIIAHRKIRAKYQAIIATVMTITSISMGLVLLALNYRQLALFIILVSIGCLCFAILNGILTNLLMLEIRNYYDSGALSGVMNGAAHIGSVLSTYVVKVIVEKTEWNVLFIILCSCALFVAIISATVFLVFRKKPEYSRFL